MAKREAGNDRGGPASRRPGIPPARLDALIEEAIVDADTESEQAGSFHVMIEQALDLPFETSVLASESMAP